MALTKNQEAALRAAPPNRRNALRQTFARQDRAKRTAPVNRTRQGPAPRVVRTPISNVPRGLEKHHFDAFASGSAVQPLSFSVGPATPIRGHNYKSLTTIPDDYYLISFNVGGGYMSMGVYRYDTSATTWIAGVYSNMVSAGFSNSGPSASSPSAFMPTRGSIRLRNTTKASDVAGVVRVLRISAGISVSGNQAALADLVRLHDRTRTYGAGELCTTHQWDQVPISQERYHSFTVPGTSATTYEDFLEDPALSTILFVIEPNSTAQDWEFSMAGNYWARYHLIGPLTNAYRLPPTIPLAITNAARDAAEKLGSAGAKVVSGAAETFGGYLGAMIAQRGAAMASRSALTAGTLALTM